jgi:hypothetical protein
MDSAPFKFAPANGLAYFEDLGWRAVEMDSVFSAAHRFDRLPGWMRPRAWLPQPDPRNPGNIPTAGLSTLRVESDYFGAVSSSAMLSGSRNSRM